MLDWKQIVRLPDDELARLNVAYMHLACSVALPGTENWNYAECFRKLNDWTEKVRWATVRQMSRFERHPEQFDFSEGYFRALVLITVLQRDCGIVYNPEKKPEEAVFEAEDSFIYGITHGKGGTCATMPVVYAAVGRGLGYPIRLVLAKCKQYHHLFCRWDGDGERFNIEATGPGLSCHPDNYYRTGMYEVPAELEQRTRLLVSLTPREELAGFLSERGHRFLDAGMFRQGAEAFAFASAMAPGNPMHYHTLNFFLNKWWDALEARKPPHFPAISVKAPLRRFPRSLPFDAEVDIMGKEAMENLLNTPKLDRILWEPLRKGQIPARLPVRALANWDETQNCQIQLEFDDNTSYFSWNIPS